MDPTVSCSLFTSTLEMTLCCLFVSFLAGPSFTLMFSSKKAPMECRLYQPLECLEIFWELISHFEDSIWFAVQKHFWKSLIVFKIIDVQNTLQWCHNGCDSISNHQPQDCLLNRLFRRRSKKTSKLRVTGLCGGIHQWPVNSPHKWPVTRKMFPFDDVIMHVTYCSHDCAQH